MAAIAPVAAPNILSSAPADVSSVQRVAFDAGLYTDKIDGVYGLKTSNAIQSAQRQLGVRSDGLINPGGATLSAFQQQGASSRSLLENRPSPHGTAQRDSLLPNEPDNAPKIKTTKQQVAKVNRMHRAKAEVEKLVKPQTRSHAEDISEITGRANRPLPELSNAATSSNRRTAEHLRKIAGTGDLSTFTAGAIANGDDKAIAEVSDLIEQVHANNPSQAKELFESTVAKLPAKKAEALKGTLSAGSDASRHPSTHETTSDTNGTDTIAPAWRGRLDKLEALANDPYANKDKRAQAQSEYDSSFITKGPDRIDAIVNDKPGLFKIRTNPDATSEKTWYESSGLGWDAVEKHNKTIEQAAIKHGVDPDLIRAVMWAENARGHKGGLNDLADITGLSNSSMPMNMNKETGARLTGKKPEDMNDAQANIDASAKFLKGLTERVAGPKDAAKVGTVWNSTSKEKTSDFGEYVGRLHREKPWIKQKPDAFPHLYP